MKKMLMVEKDNTKVYMVNEGNVINTLVDYLKTVSEVKTETYTGDLKFEQLPIEVQEEVKSTLRAFDRCYVVYENLNFKVSASIGITASYAKDHYFCGEYKAKDIYTLEERRKNFIEEFGYAPTYLN